ncbi:MAG: RNA polymerase sigma factor [Chthonomonadales bacterium]
MRAGSMAQRIGAVVTGERASNLEDADNYLVSRFLDGDRSAFDTLFAKYQDYVYNIVFGILGKPDESQDVTADVFVTVFRSLKGFRRGSRFATWLYRIAVNRAVDSTRSARLRSWLPFDDATREIPDTADTPERVFDKKESRGIVQKVLMKVPVKYRDILVLRYYQDLSIEEISEVLSCTISAAKVRLHRARLQFKEKYVEEFGTDTNEPFPMP